MGYQVCYEWALNCLKNRLSVESLKNYESTMEPKICSRVLTMNSNRVSMIYAAITIGYYTSVLSSIFRYQIFQFKVPN